MKHLKRQKLTTIQKSMLAMGTVIDIQVVAYEKDRQAVLADMDRAFSLFYEIERKFSRFRSDSEVMNLSNQPRQEVFVSEMLFDLTAYALELAELTNGRYDPTIGKVMEEKGFNRMYMTGQTYTSHVPDASVHYRDIKLNEENRTIYLEKPLILDFGSIAKGFACDLAAKELEAWEGFMMNAGGDVLVSGFNEYQEEWSIGIRHPIQKQTNMMVIQTTNCAICTSGSYERISRDDPHTHHLIHPQTKLSEKSLLSCTVIAPLGMLADSLSTAAFILGEKEGYAFLTENELPAVMINKHVDITTTPEMKEVQSWN
ncbi:thiamine biosynthesis protein ApbE [Bacillus xiamenensis]|uniref:FAD:protein FMN transferase n=1 Tax=Bacillus xiamenensis TaxID=1178537 RepID=A0ABT4F2X6_9BACI|nr:FAD:protein FMN transferase [Bacillus xiamenensis]MBG9913257.1 thiamine biosynthesis protein ApbE [Bacillus xiamenensis]MCY9576406.1 FAD:protein FMN transferase [Bacillus xiamenensis]